MFLQLLQEEVTTIGDAEEEEIEQKLKPKKNKFDEAKNRVCSMNVYSNVKAFSDISCDEFSTQIIIGEFGKDGKLRDGSDLIEFATEEAANKAIKFQRLDLLGYTVKLSPQLEGATGAASKRLFMKGLSYFSDKSDVIKFFKEAGEIVDVHLSYNGDRKFSGSGHIEFVTEEAAKKTGRLNGVELLGSCVELYHKAEGTGASRTLCLKNVPLTIDKYHVIDFFENVEDIADVRFSYDEYGTFGRFAHVEFATGEAAKQAVRWNGRDLKGCPVELGIVFEALCVQGFDISSGIDQIRIFLINFRTCKSIVQVDNQKDHTTGVPTELLIWMDKKLMLPL
ncbi:hypothetical protein MKW98_032249 [Papaver atlanticum]|uniref:RRM domain-containing protein n=1 Tax=Papaver atlanticum TaxID=357466 RepID=A0AAD4SGS3_9MAGN|nr:hypothetical protein MKW98_032249 [Papaver atlanticum]